MPPKVCFMQLSSCWGCYQSLIDNYGQDLIDILTSIDIVYFPAVVDFKHSDLESYGEGEIDIGIIEGNVRTTDDLENTKLVREKSKLVISLGSCACFGGIPSLANLYSKDALIERKYKTVESIVETQGLPTENVPGILDSIPPVHDVVDVDIWIPGCPPKTDHIIAAFKYLLSLPAREPSDQNMCDICTLRGEKCFLNRGILCFGPLASADEKLQYPNKGEVCYGASGPTKNIAKDEAQKLVKLVTSKELDGNEVADILKFLTLYAKIPNLGYMYVKGDPLQALGHNRADYPEKTIELDGSNVKALDLNGFPDEIGILLHAVSKSPEFHYTEQTVCATCPRNKENKQLKEIKRDYEGGVKDQEKCLLEQGYLCMGIVTKGGCGALCIKANCPCLGCYGPSPNIVDAGGKFTTSLASISTNMTVPDLQKKIPDPAGQFYRFMTAVSPFKKKQNDTGME
ncbi:MAG: hypothetical protein EU548_01255 [Promethearchaeota archaeon]|nr:MAG: hypothetical protein EU548_01255 [Candidatus Lokiarchaeota archaeon]